MKNQLVAAVLTVCAVLTAGQQVCDPLDSGPFLATRPTLEFSVQETTSSDTLSSNCGADEKFRSQVRLVGAPGAFTLSVSNYPWVNPLDYFTLVSCGGVNYLQLTQPIDRDGPTSSVEDDLSFISATLTCTPTSGTPVTYDARFFIFDVNDNMPKLEDVEQTISEATSVGDLVMTLMADDLDANLDENITYSLGNLQDHFSLDAVSGQLTLAKELDYETMGSEKSLEVTVFAEDGGPGQKQTATATVKLLVADSDDNGPAFVYDGCFEHDNVCAWPKYTTGLTHKKDEPIAVLPVPNKVMRQVEIEAMDLDLAIGSEIVFSIASTIPPGQENEFRVDTQKLTVGNKYQASIVPLRDMTVQEGFEIFLKAEENTVEKKHEIAMIYFMGDGSSTAGGQGSGKPSDDDDDDYSDREVALIAVTAILATFVLCLTIALLVCFLRRSKRQGGADFQMGATNNGYTS